MVEHPIATFPVHMLNIIQALWYVCMCGCTVQVRASVSSVKYVAQTIYAMDHS